MYNHSLEHLRAELGRLDLLLYRQILHLRASYQLSLDEFRGLYISDEQVDLLVNQMGQQEGKPQLIQDLTEQAEHMRRTNEENASETLPWKRLCMEFKLTPFEQDVLLLAVAPEVDLKYELLYAYLNNDITRKWPTVHLALDLFEPEKEQKMRLRSHLLSEAPLFTTGLLQPVSSSPEPLPWLGRGFVPSPLVWQYLLELPLHDPFLTPFVRQRLPAVTWDQIPIAVSLQEQLRGAFSLSEQITPGTFPPLLVFEGHPGTGRSLAAEALCGAAKLSLLSLDLEALCSALERIPEISQRLALYRRLQPCGIVLERGEMLFEQEGRPLSQGIRLLQQLAQGQGPVFFLCPPGVRWRELLKGLRSLAFHFTDPDYLERQRLWQAYLAQEKCFVDETTATSLANHFTLTPQQIHNAVVAAVDTNKLQEESDLPLSFEVLAEAARAQSAVSLGNLALRVALTQSWKDLILPPPTLRRVKEVASAIKHRHLVYTEWGFERRITMGKGFKVLFTGSPGTGKTMTAGVIARDLGQDLYRIDLSGVVSKYIGETEKNLERIFRASHQSNTILFFDEADALFGKRSEVKDAHDRYANIEVAYLLQKMEEHEGVIILASNLSKNIDEAFARRMHYVVEFPLPDEVHREKLWRGMFASGVPLGTDIDFPFLARQFSLAGGDIKNVALDAAFLAAGDGQIVTMRHLVQAMARQMQKQGKLLSPADFRQYHSMIVQGE